MESKDFNRIQESIVKAITRRFKGVYLSAGTALRMHLGHRFSEDLDFFMQDFDAKLIHDVMEFAMSEWGYSYQFEGEENRPGYMRMKVYYLAIQPGQSMKVDFLEDYSKNINPIQKGLHSTQDIYYRKLITAMGISSKKDELNQVIPSGRQSVKDAFDIYICGKKVEELTSFFPKHFDVEVVEKLQGWLKRFNRTEFKTELVDLVEGIDSKEVLHSLDVAILEKLPQVYLEDI